MDLRPFSLLNILIILRICMTTTKPATQPTGKQIYETLQSNIVEGYQGGGAQALLSWGLDPKIITTDVSEFCKFASIRFKITQGSNYNGWCQITLTDKDYSIIFEAYSNKTGDLNTSRSFKNVPADQLATVVDRVVEGDPSRP